MTAATAARIGKGVVLPSGEREANTLRLVGQVNAGFGLIAAIGFLVLGGELGFGFAVAIFVESAFAWAVCYAAASVVENVFVIRMLLEMRRDSAEPAPSK